jgi:hypothetical protein
MQLKPFLKNIKTTNISQALNEYFDEIVAVVGTYVALKL